MTIRNDSSRPSARLSGGRRARSVVARQGQVLLDTDLNEAGASATERSEIDSLDTLGRVAAPFHDAGFAIGPNGSISKGRLYLDGLLAENLAACTLQTQPHPSDPVPAKGAVVGLKALVRMIDPVEDRRLADKALADAAASGRALVDWQVFTLPFAGPETPGCTTVLPDWDKLVMPSSGRMSARVDPGAPPANFCSPAVGGGFSRLENLHYRVEVDGGIPVAGYSTVDGPRFGLDGLRLKFSRRNASIMARIIGYDGRKLTVDPPAVDTGQWFAPGSVAEIVSIDDDVDATQAVAQIRLFQVAKADGAEVTLGTAGTLPLPAVADLGTDWCLRLWDCLPDFTISTTTTLASTTLSKEIGLGDGARITLQSAASGDTVFRRGDYWSFTARVDGTIDWPVTGANVATPRTPDGPAIHYARLAVASSPVAQPSDCRPVFLPLIEQMELRMAGGDGQSAFLGDAENSTFVPLRAPLRVLVLCGGLPVPGAQVAWTGAPGYPGVRIDGSPQNITTTDAQGLADVAVELDQAGAAQLYAIEATLVSPVGHPAVSSAIFYASFDTAARTSYQPGACDLLGKTTNVQDALDTLCKNIGYTNPDALTLRQITLLGAERGTLIRQGILNNGADIRPEWLAEGMTFEVDRGPLAKTAQLYDPIVDVELEIPYPTTDVDLRFWADSLDGMVQPFGTHRLRLAGFVEIEGKIIRWHPLGPARDFLMRWERHGFGLGARAISADADGDLRILTRIRLRSQLIWLQERGRVDHVEQDPRVIAMVEKIAAMEAKAKGKKLSIKGKADFERVGAELSDMRQELAFGARDAKRIYLNAEYLGRFGPNNHRALAIDDRDPQRAADLDMFLYLHVQMPKRPGNQTFVPGKK